MSLKHKILSLYQHDTSSLHLIFSERTLNEDELVKSCHIKDGDTIIARVQSEAEKCMYEVEVEGDNKAKTKLAYYKLSGYGGCDIDVDEAVALLKKRVEDKDTEAMWLLGLCYEYGMGCEQDLKEAESLYKQSRDGGNEVGLFFVNTGKDKRGTGVINVYEGL